MQEGHVVRILYLFRNDAHQKHDLHIKKFLSSRCSSNCNFFFNGNILHSNKIILLSVSEYDILTHEIKMTLEIEITHIFDVFNRGIIGCDYHKF